MPQSLMDCVKDCMKKGMSQDKAYAICAKSTGWKKAKGGKWKNTKTDKEYKGK